MQVKLPVFYTENILTTVNRNLFCCVHETVTDQTSAARFEFGIVSFVNLLKRQLRHWFVILTSVRPRRMWL